MKHNSGKFTQSTATLTHLSLHRNLSEVVNPLMPCHSNHNIARSFKSFFLKFSCQLFSPNPVTKLPEGVSETQASELCKREDKCVGRSAERGRGKERIRQREKGWRRALNNRPCCTLAAKIGRWAWSAPAARSSSSNSLCPLRCSLPCGWVAGWLW